MSVTEILLSILSAAGIIFGIIFGYIAFSRNKTQDETSSASDIAEIKSDIKYIKESIGKIDSVVEKQSSHISDLQSRVLVIENMVDKKR